MSARAVPNADAKQRYDAGLPAGAPNAKVCDRFAITPLHYVRSAGEAGRCDRHVLAGLAVNAQPKRSRSEKGYT